MKTMPQYDFEQFCAEAVATFGIDFVELFALTAMDHFNCPWPPPPNLRLPIVKAFLETVVAAKLGHHLKKLTKH